jgi:anti-sigma regulatory factor (Ser/Thr protein kinase)
MVSDSVVGEWALVLDPNTEAPRRARAATASFLREWDMKELVEDATLVVGELSANAVKLGQAFELRLIADRATLRIEVSDHSPGEPVITTEVGDDRAEGGRGLLLVDALADLWGFDVRSDGGKTIWAVLACP